MNKPAGITREQLIKNLNGDLAHEYQAVIAYVTYSQVLKGAQYMNIARELQLHASEELAHALLIAKQIDYLGGTPTVTPEPVKSSKESQGDARSRPAERIDDDRQLPCPPAAGGKPGRVRDFGNPA